MYSLRIHWQLPLLLCLWASNSIGARQIRINRYAASVQEDDVQQAVSREVAPIPTPYPPAGRPQGRAFWLPGEASENEGSGLDQLTTTTESPFDSEITSTTDVLGLSTTTTIDLMDSTTTTTAPVEPRSGRAFVKAPYPAAGYRPSRAFFLPTELKALEQQLTARNSTVDAAVPNNNSNHPVCGVSTNPLKPTPEPGYKAEPDAESVVISEPAVVIVRPPGDRMVPVAIPLRSQRLITAPRRQGFTYTTHVEQRW
ncbi:CG14572 [Drosophila busckii]|uniref:CG14572 n=1 Tax=Drosophila busckii TaxID=30019 RepID=A0A0M3QX33_DROBS|nr:CG14572 [Drosophila busckii]